MNAAFIKSIRNRVTLFNNGKRYLYTFALMLFFFGLFDSIISFVTPIFITDQGFSATAMGLIYSSSSVTGAVFDIVLAKALKKINYRRLLLTLFILCSFMPLVLWKSVTVWAFLLAMGIWGLYYDLESFAWFDFVSTKSPKGSFAEHFAHTGGLRSLGYVIGPILAGYAMEALSKSGFMNITYIFLFISVFLFILLLFLDKGDKHNPIEIEVEEIKHSEEVGKKGLILWKDVIVAVYPVLIFSLILEMYDSIIWTIGPLLANDFPSVEGFEGIFVALGTVPGLFAGILVGRFTRNYGKKRVAFISLALGNAMCVLFLFVSNPYAVLAIFFAASTLSCLAWPATRGVFADYLEESGYHDNQIQGLNDLIANIGYIIGPILGGLLADLLGGLRAIVCFAVFSVVISIVLLFFYSKKDLRIEK